MSTERVKIVDHNPAGGQFMTPHGVVATDKDGYADVTPEQLAHLKTRRGLSITTRNVKSADVSNRAIRGKE